MVYNIEQAQIINYIFAFISKISGGVSRRPV